ncbi:hypothetical protein [Halobellus litoreus]|uniref:Uncharacterized protein n=1 Tax=Halobellus litoreus TaxID=755310 RepID=A0ABD6E1Z0_9EURY|nr:hypothetical protein [Halobellus litoreus]
MNRRRLLTTIGVSGTASLTGCIGRLTGNGEEENDPTLEEFQYFFVDETGTLGEPAEGQQPPEDAEDWQIVKNTLEESDWQEKQENDVERARGYLAGEATDVTGSGPDGGEVFEGTVEEIVQRTQEMYENPEEEFDPSSGTEGHILEEMQQEDDPVAFTRALIHATDTVTDVTSSGGKDFLAPNLAEYAMEELGLDFPEYELSTMISTEPTGLEDQMIEGSMRETEGGQTIGTTGMRHLLSLLTYENEDGELQNKYVENIKAHPTSTFRSMLRDPEDSAYREPIEGGRFKIHENTQGAPMWPEHYATAFEQEKLENMREMGLDIDNPGEQFTMAALAMVDDGLNDISKLPNEGYQITVSDEIKEQAEDFALNPTKDKKEKIENFGKMAYSVLEKEIGEDFKNDPIYGADNPIRIEGSLETPEFYHEPREKYVSEQ